MATLPDFETADDMAGGEAISEQMDDMELVSILRAHEAQAIGYQPGSGDEISSQQERAINYYYGIMDDTPAQEGCSAVVDWTVQTVIDNAMSAVLKPFVGSDETVRFAPRGPEDEEQADQATEYVNYVFNVDNPGFRIMYDWAKDGLLTKLGVVKVWWESEKKIDAQQVPIENDIHAQMLRSHPQYMGEDQGAAMIGQVVENGKVKIENVPPEEFRISRFSRSVATAIYAAHCPSNMTRSDLVEMGVDEEIAESLPAYSGLDAENTTRIARYQDERIGDTRVDTPHKSQDIIAVRDEYVRIDYDGDGVAELRRVVRVEDTIILNETVDESPFAAWCPIPMPHKVHGLSLADPTMQLQQVNTVLWRQMLDNLYKSNNPRPVVAESAERMDGSTAETLGDAAPGAEILVRDISGLRYEAVPYTAGASLPMLEMVGAMVEERTGVSRAGQGLDSNSLRAAGQMTATEASQVMSGKNARMEMMARIFAEDGVKRLFKLILGLVTKHQDKERTIRLRNKWVPIDPRGWPEMDLEVSVGLGVGEKSEQIMQADSVLQTMEVLGASPYASLLSADNVYAAVKRKFTAAGIKNADEFLTEPPKGPDGQPAPQQPRPDPEMVKVQSEAQLKQQAQQADQMAMQAKWTLAEQDQQHRQTLAQQQAEFEAQLADAKAARESQLAQEKMDRETVMAARSIELAHEHKMRLADIKASTDLPANRPGGDLSE